MMRLLEFLAVTDTKINPSDIGLKPVTNADNAVASILTTVYGAAGIICIMIIIIAGYIYVTSSGDPSNTKRAREAILGSVIGIIVILMAFTITQFVLGRF